LPIAINRQTNKTIQANKNKNMEEEEEEGFVLVDDDVQEDFVVVEKIDAAPTDDGKKRGEKEEEEEEVKIVANSNNIGSNGNRCGGQMIVVTNEYKTVSKHVNAEDYPSLAASVKMTKAKHDNNSNNNNSNNNNSNSNDSKKKRKQDLNHSDEFNAKVAAVAAVFPEMISEIPAIVQANLHETSERIVDLITLSLFERKKPAKNHHHLHHLLETAATPRYKDDLEADEEDKEKEAAEAEKKAVAPHVYIHPKCGKGRGESSKALQKQRDVKVGTASKSVC